MRPESMESMPESMPESRVKATESRPEATLEAMSVESMAESAESMTPESTEASMEDVESGGEMECGCREVTVVSGIIDAMRALRKRNLKGRVEAVSSIGAEEWRGIWGDRKLLGVEDKWDQARATGRACDGGTAECGEVR